jgi:hypothetical protein
MTPHDRLPSGRRKRSLMGRPSGVGKGLWIPAPWREGQRFRRVRVPPYSSGLPLLFGGEVETLGGPGRKGPFWERSLRCPVKKGRRREHPRMLPFVRPPRGLMPFLGRVSDTPKKGKDPIPLRREGGSPLWRQPLPSDTSASADSGPLDDRPCRTSLGPPTSDGPDALSLCIGPRCTPRTSQVRLK